MMNYDELLYFLRNITIILRKSIFLRVFKINKSEFKIDFKDLYLKLQEQRVHL
jgi:hypothetical protein